MFNIYVVRFDVTKNLEKFFFELNKALGAGVQRYR